jgi:hypothetical protein
MQLMQLYCNNATYATILQQRMQLYMQLCNYATCNLYATMQLCNYATIDRPLELDLNPRQKNAYHGH